MLKPLHEKYKKRGARTQCTHHCALYGLAPSHSMRSLTNHATAHHMRCLFHGSAALDVHTCDAPYPGEELKSLQDRLASIQNQALQPATMLTLVFKRRMMLCTVELTRIQTLTISLTCALTLT